MLKPLHFNRISEYLSTNNTVPSSFPRSMVHFLSSINQSITWVYSPRVFVWKPSQSSRLNVPWSFGASNLPELQWNLEFGEKCPKSSRPLISIIFLFGLGGLKRPQRKWFHTIGLRVLSQQRARRTLPVYLGGGIFLFGRSQATRNDGAFFPRISCEGRRTTNSTQTGRGNFRLHVRLGMGTFRLRKPPHASLLSANAG